MDLERAKDDVGVFAKELIGESLWPHQEAVVHSTARIRAMASGRQAGKSRTLAVEALHTAFAKPGSLVLLVSAGEQASKDLLAHISALAQAQWLGASVVDDSKQILTFTNGSEIRSVPASVRQIRGLAVDLLVLDEASYIDSSIWTAARYSIIARPGSRVIACSTPWGRQDHWFATTYRAGLSDTRVDNHESFHWPSTASPLVDRTLLELWRQTSTDREYRAEVEAEWVDDAGAYFTSEELASATAEELVGFTGGAVAGVDWGFSHDASAAVILGCDGESYCVLHAEERYKTPYSTFIDRLVELARDYDLEAIHSETNGVGQGPSQQLEQTLRAYRLRTRVVPISTTSRTKEDSYGALKLAMQQHRLVLPRHPALLRQLSALSFEFTDAGSMRISVPQTAGHDDLAMALCLAASSLPEASGPRPQPARARFAGASTNYELSSPLRVRTKTMCSPEFADDSVPQEGPEVSTVFGPVDRIHELLSTGGPKVVAEERLYAFDRGSWRLLMRAGGEYPAAVRGELKTEIELAKETT